MKLNAEGGGIIRWLKNLVGSTAEISTQVIRSMRLIQSYLVLTVVQEVEVLES